MPRPHLLGALALACTALPAQAQTPCTDGVADGFPCEGIDLLSRMSLIELGSPRNQEGNDSWGWADAASGREFALMGLTDATAFVEVTDPTAPVLLGRLPTRTSTSIWRDIKTVGDYAYIVSEASNHGIQVFDLTRLLDVASPPQAFTADAVYTGFGNAHNIVALPERDLVAGVDTDGCGIDFVDVSDPLNPVDAGCFNGAGGPNGTHDAQCVVYNGPDPDHQGRSICIIATGGDFAIADATDPQNTTLLSRVAHDNVGYAHQGWLTEDQRYFIADDETDEGGSRPTRTLIFDVSDLDEPVHVGSHAGTTTAIDHNLYTLGDLVFEANYMSGLRVLEMGDLAEAELTEVAFFDTYPLSNSPSFLGAWSVYPYLPSGTIIVSDINRGLFVLGFSETSTVDTAGTPEAPATRLALFPNPTAGAARLHLTVAEPGPVTVEVFDVLGRRAAVLHAGPVGADGLQLTTGALPAGTYLVRARGERFVTTERLTVTR